jgi:SAM-dependent methyltransferase
MSTWHYGLVADWWAEFNVDGPEIDYFGRYVAEGQPALDAGCGTGRLLLPWLRAGYDVDGSDVSADMIERTRARAGAEGFEPALLVQPLHELDPPRRYRTIVLCGVFGIGSTRAQDEEALSRLHAALEPGGTLLIDKEVPWTSSRWRFWHDQSELPQPWPENSEPRRTSDGSELQLLVRTTALDPLDQRVTFEMRARRLVDSAVVAEETYVLTERYYFPRELTLLLERAGFRGVEILHGHEQRPPGPDTDFLVYVARG